MICFASISIAKMVVLIAIDKTPGDQLSQQDSSSEDS